MADRYLEYLSREHARLEDKIRQESKRPRPDEVLIARLKKLKLALKDQMQSWAGTRPSPDHRRDLLRAERRRQEGLRRRLRRLRHQAVQSAAAAGEDQGILAVASAAGQSCSFPLQGGRLGWGWKLMEVLE